VAGVAGVLVCIVGGTWLLSTRFGLHLRAVGGDEHAARMSGVRVENVKAIAYVLAGLLAALGGMYLTTITASGSPTTGDSYILTSIAAVVIGGVPLSGGRGAHRRRHGRLDSDDHRKPAVFRRPIFVLSKRDRRPDPARRRRQRRYP
jgi:ribose/xylose/arabinose/galactoside ABC-type transport system permease subunit